MAGSRSGSRGPGSLGLSSLGRVALNLTSLNLTSLNLTSLNRAALGLALLGLVLAAGPARAEPVASYALRVCQDPNNLPFSSEKGGGIENRIAEVFGKSMNLPVEYFSFPNRLAFVRNTLNYRLPGEDYRCDVILGVPAGWGQVVTTEPYYRSTYAITFRQDGPFEGVDSGDAFLARLKVLGQQARHRIGVYDKSPATRWLENAGLADSAEIYLMQSPRADQYPGEIIEHELVDGRLDAVIVWGPIAGYYARQIKQPALAVVPLKSANGIRFDFEIAMGVRRGEPKWKARIEEEITKNRDAIQAILADYGVPLVADEDASPR